MQPVDLAKTGVTDLRVLPFPSPQVRFSRPESEQARQRRVQSYEFLQKKQAEEPWVHLHYYGVRVSQGRTWEEP